MAKPVSPNVQQPAVEQPVVQDEGVDPVDDDEEEESRGDDAGAQGESGAADAGGDDQGRRHEGDDNPDVDERGEEIEAQSQRIATGPVQPTAAEVEEHELNGHAQFRSWCRACVLGRAKDAPSRRIRGAFAESVLPRVRMDYCFLTDDSGESGEGGESRASESITCAVMHESLCDSAWAYAVKSKGSTERWLIDQVVEDLETVGLKNERLVLKSDQEPSIVDVMREVQRARESEYGTAMDNSRVGDSDSNGTIENRIGSFEGMARTLRIALEQKIGEKLPISHPVMPWLIRHAAHVITRSWIRPSGRTAYQMIKGRRSNVAMKEFGEAVFFRIPDTKDTPGKFEPRWEEGVYLGFNIRSGEDVVSTRAGVFRVSTVRRKPLNERWSKQLLDEVCGSPETPIPTGTTRKIPTFARKYSEDQGPRPQPEFRKQEIPVTRTRRFQISKKDIENFGPSDRCPGCRAVIAGHGKAPHTEECRVRIEGELMKSDEGKQRLARADDRLAHELVRRAGMDPYSTTERVQGGEGSAPPDDLPPMGDEHSDANLARAMDRRHGTGGTTTTDGDGGAGDGGMTDGNGGGQRVAETPDPGPSVPARPRDDPLRQRLQAKARATRTGTKRPADGEADDSNRGDPQEAEDTTAATPPQAATSPGTLPTPAAPGAPMGASTASGSGGPGTTASASTAAGSSSAPSKRNGQPPDTSRRTQMNRRGEKRGAEEPPDDPRANDVDNPEISSTTKTHKCGQCDEAFESRNQLFDHLREENHTVVSDDDEVSSTEKEKVKKWVPGMQVSNGRVKPKDTQWRDIGSGMVAKTFLGVTSLVTTSRHGPPMGDIQSRRIWSLTKGKLIDEADIDDTPDHILHRRLPQPDDIRVELVLKGAQAMYKRRGPDIAEVYSNPRICQEATARTYDGRTLRPGWSLDLKTKDPETGEPWDLSKRRVQERVRQLVRETAPYCIVGSPPCTPFSQIQGLNKKKRDKAVIRREWEEGRRHIRFCLELYRMQVSAGRHYVHEHPKGSAAWKLPEVQQFVLETQAEIVDLNMCAFGMKARDEQGVGLVSKPTRIMTSAHEVAKRVNRKCCGGHRHVHLVSGRARAAQVYPRELCERICEGISVQRKLEELGVEAIPVMSVEEMKRVARSREGEDPSEALHEQLDERMIAFDDVTGDALDPALMRIARKEEILYFKEMGVYEKVDVEEAYRITGKGPIAVRWVDINKGDTANPKYRSRLVAKEFNTGVNHDLYAATPPSECLRLMLSLLASSREKGTTLMYADVSRAYFYAKAERPVYVKLPAEDMEPGDEGKCGKLKMSMYGTRDAALNWANEYGETLREAGFKQGSSNTCLFHNHKLGVSVMVHGDDFVAIGTEEDLKTTRAVLENKYKIKV